MAFSHRFVAIALLLSLATLSSACLKSCRFTFCKFSKKPTFVSLYRKSDVPLTARICLGGKKVGVVNTGEARIKAYNGKYRPISKIYFKGLKQKFSPHFFKAYAIRKNMKKTMSKKMRYYYNRGSAVGHEVPQQNQKKFLGGKCVALPVNQYQKLYGKNVVDNINLYRPLVDCISFIVKN